MIFEIVKRCIFCIGVIISLQDNSNFVSNVENKDESVYIEKEIMTNITKKINIRIRFLLKLTKSLPSCLEIVIPEAAALFELEQVGKCCGIRLDSEAPRFPLSVRNP